MKGHMDFGDWLLCHVEISDWPLRHVELGDWLPEAAAWRGCSFTRQRRE
jgi:hypothetical protein